MNVKFYDPHPGLAGCMVQLPEPIRLFAQKIDGTTADLDKTVKKISKLAGKGFSVESTGTAILLSFGSIDLGKSGNTPRHIWRVVRFSETA